MSYATDDGTQFVLIVAGFVLQLNWMQRAKQNAEIPPDGFGAEAGQHLSAPSHVIGQQPGIVYQGRAHTGPCHQPQLFAGLFGRQGEFSQIRGQTQ